MDVTDILVWLGIPWFTLQSKPVILLYLIYMGYD
jgi:hypothetical protein